jgi:PAS domain S-box-containing protein
MRSLVHRAPGTLFAPTLFMPVITENSMNLPLNVLVLEGRQPSIGRAEWLLNGNCSVSAWRRVCRNDLDAALDAREPDLVLADYAVPDAEFVGALAAIRHRGLDVPVILLTDHVDDAKAAELFELGVCDFLLRADVHRLPNLLIHAQRERTHQRAERTSDDQRKRSEGRYRQVFLNASDSLFVFPLSADGQPGRFTDVNKAASDMLGYTCGELLQLSPPDLVDPSELDGLPAKFRELLSQKHQHVEMMMVTKDGRRIPTEISGTLFDLESQATVLGIVTNVTGKKRAAEMFRQATESAIRRHRSQARVDAMIVALLSLVVFLISGPLNALESVGGWIVRHPAIERVTVTLGFLACASVVYAWRRRKEIHSEVVERTRVEDALRGLHGELENQVQRRTAELLEANNELRAEMAERQRTESLLRLQSAALDASADAIIITDENGQIAWVNPAFTTLTGYSATAAVGRNPRELLKSGVQDETFYREMWDTITSGLAWRGEITNRRKDGTFYSENMTITPVRNTEHAITHYVAIKRDVTEEKRLKAQFLQAQKMESVGRLAGGIAHDFNNLLTVINGTAELACDALTGDHPLRADFAEIQKAGERAAALTRQLLAFSRKQVSKPQILTLATLVADMRSLLQRMIGEDIALTLAPASGQAAVKADPGQIEQVLMNLVVNARDAMPNGGTLTIETKNVEIQNADDGHFESMYPGSYVLLSIRDTGTGMTEQTRARLFEPFFTTKEQGKGTGLGLATVYGIVEQSGGHITVETALGQGTTFRIYLPAVLEATTKRSARSGVTPATGAETILVVEDEPAVQQMARRMLTAGGHTVLTANSGADALRVLESHRRPVHLMLSDVVMPGMSGPDLAAQVAVTRPRMKVLFMSGHTENAALRLTALESSETFIGKPYTMSQLLRKVRQVLDSAVMTGAFAPPVKETMQAEAARREAS